MPPLTSWFSQKLGWPLTFLARRSTLLDTPTAEEILAADIPDV